MPISAPLYGGRRRVFVSHKSIADTSLAANVTVLNLLDGSSFMGPGTQDILPNANQAQGQGEWPTRLYAGGKNLTGTYRTWLSSEALSLFAAMAMPSGSVTTDGTAQIHNATVPATSNTLKPHTIQESLRGAASTDQAYKIKAAICNSFGINVARGNQFAQIEAEMIGNDLGTAADLSAEDIQAQWPIVPGMSPTKCGLWLAPTTTSNHTTAFDGAIGTPGTVGLPFEDLGAEFKFSLYTSSFGIKFNNNLNLDDLYPAGVSTVSGFLRSTATAYPVNRTCELTMNIDVNAAASGPLTLLEFLKNFADASQQSYTMQFTAVSDAQIGATGKYYAVSIVVPAMYLTAADLGGELGPLTETVTLMGMQDYAGSNYITVYTWDATATDYYAIV